ncbi:AAA family ATPase [Blastomonas sp. CACIA14H2]|uniref:AAA family ATPase n=1 Tax=Blastomonas sp. CACIA14H2 TaxID=1419876 RepID=UPI00267DFA84
MPDIQLNQKDIISPRRNQLTGFAAIGILGNRNYRLKLDGSTAIIVGPNGTGKSTFLSLLYLFVSRQWQRLNDYEFEELILFHSHGEINLTKADLLSFDVAPSKRSTTDHLIGRVQAANAMDLLYKSSLTRDERQKLASITGFAESQLISFRRYVQAEYGFTKRAYEIDADVSSLNLGQILYLPTYRRIEKDIKSIFPDIENRIRSRLEDSQITARAGQGFREIAGFGMGDIQALVDHCCSDIRDFRRQASETASQEYIRDIVTGKIRKYSLSNLRRMPDDDFEKFKNSLDDKLFSSSDRHSLRKRIDDLRRRSTGQPNAESRFLGMFVEKLLSAHIKVKDREQPLQLFVNLLTSYLGPEKRAVLIDHQIVIFSQYDEVIVPLDKLSSGEKQIVSIFAYLLLSGQRDFIVLIDEPELSLSMPWQKRFLPDIISTGSCANIVAVTHSPFVFDNHLNKSVVDVRRLKVSEHG